MRPARLLAALVVALILAGCATPAREAGVGEVVFPSLEIPERPLLPPIQPPTPLLAPHQELIHRNQRSLDSPDGEPAPVSVPPNAIALRFSVESNVSWDGVVELRDPEGVTRATCGGTWCETMAYSPSGGTWHLHFPDTAPGQLTTTVWAILRPWEEPPTPTPTPPTRPAATEGEPMTIYVHGHDFSDGSAGPSQRHVLALPAGHARLLLKTSFEPTSDGAAVWLFDPRGEAAGRCTGESPTCAFEVSAPQAGLWSLYYRGEAESRVSVSLTVFPTSAFAPPANMTAYEASHPYPAQHPWNRTEMFLVSAEYPRLGWSVSFRHAGEAGEGDTPRVVLVDPTGMVRARCEAGPRSVCPSQLDTNGGGMWRVHFLGPATGSVDVHAFAHGRAPAPGEPAPADPWATSAGTLHEATHHLDGRVFSESFHVPEGYPRMYVKSLVPDATEDFPLYRLYDPEGQLRLDCRWASCALPVEAPAPGAWRFEYAPSQPATLQVKVDVFRD